MENNDVVFLVELSRDETMSRETLFKFYEPTGKYTEAGVPIFQAREEYRDEGAVHKSVNVIAALLFGWMG